MKEQSNVEKASSLIQLFDFPKEKRGFGTQESILTLPDLALQVGLKNVRMYNAREIDQFTFTQGLTRFKDLVIKASVLELRMQPGTKNNPYQMCDLENALPKVAISYINMAYLESLITSFGSIEDPLSSVFVANSKYLFEKVTEEIYQRNLEIIVLYRSILLGIKNKTLCTKEVIPTFDESQILLKFFRDEILITSQQF
jgi:hypothetical protein